MGNHRELTAVEKAREFTKLASSFADLGDAIMSQVNDVLNDPGKSLEEYNTNALRRGAEWFFDNGMDGAGELLENLIEEILEADASFV